METIVRKHYCSLPPCCRTSLVCSREAAVPSAQVVILEGVRPQAKRQKGITAERLEGVVRSSPRPKYGPAIPNRAAPELRWQAGVSTSDQHWPAQDAKLLGCLCLSPGRKTPQLRTSSDARRNGHLCNSWLHQQQKPQEIVRKRGNWRSKSSARPQRTLSGTLR